MSQLFIKPADQFMGKCDNCKYLLVYEKIGKSFLIYNYIKCEKKNYEFQFGEKFNEKSENNDKICGLDLKQIFITSQGTILPLQIQGWTVAVNLMKLDCQIKRHSTVI